MPAYEDRFKKIIAENCSTEYNTYIAVSGAHEQKLWCRATVSCILGATDESTKASLSSSNVLLGLVPVILTLMGPNTAESALLSIRRPVLALFLSMGSPSKDPMRAISYQAPVDEMIRQKKGRLLPHRNLNPLHAKIILAFEYMLAGAAVANVYHQSWIIGRSTVFNPLCSESFGPLVWTGFAIVIYILGVVVFRLRAAEHDVGRNSRERGSRAFLKNEVTLCGSHVETCLKWKPESLLFVSLAWAVSLLTIVHLIFGTLWFASILFVSVLDSLGILGRYMASAIVCRAIVMFELSGMRQTMLVEDETEPFVLESESSTAKGSAKGVDNVSYHTMEMR